MRPSTPASCELTGHFDPEDERQYRHEPFTVPPGVHDIHLEITYNERIGSNPLRRGGNTLDIGLFDDQGIEPGGIGFRGWSGSELVALTIAKDWATPPYRPGSIGAGIWNLLLGPYKIGKHGLDYRIEVWFNANLPRQLPPVLRATATFPADVNPAAEPGWYRGDLHSHSLFSDGDSWPSELLLLAAERGLDFLAITDHNGAVRPTSTEDQPPLLLIPGIEVTTYFGHWNVWGVDSWFDFRTSTADEVRAEMERASKLGGLIGINHPKPWGPEWEYAGLDVQVDTIEVWNGPWERLNVFALAEWDQRLMEGKRLFAVGGSDAHYLRSDRTSGAMRDAQIGEPTTWVQVEGALTTDSFLAGLRTGRAFVSASPDGPQLFQQRLRDDMLVRVVGANGATLQTVSDGVVIANLTIDSPDWSTKVSIPASTGYVRVQVTNAGGLMLAIANPVWPTP